jgi:hypothetical protein
VGGRDAGEIADGILGLDLDAAYDPSRISIVGIQTTGIGTGLAPVQSSRDGTLGIAAFGIAPLSGSGPALTITVEGRRPTGGVGALRISGAANEGAIPLRIRHGRGGSRGGDPDGGEASPGPDRRFRTRRPMTNGALRRT